MQSTRSLSRNTTFTFGALPERFAELFIGKHAPIIRGAAPSTTPGKPSCGNWRILRWILVYNPLNFIKFLAADGDDIYTRAVEAQGSGKAPCSVMFSSQMHESQEDAIIRTSVFFHILSCPHLSAGFCLFEVRGVVVWALTFGLPLTSNGMLHLCDSTIAGPTIVGRMRLPHFLLPF